MHEGQDTNIEKSRNLIQKKEFKQALLRGQGRCILAVQKAPEKYREQVLWACQNNIAFDTQCEGARSWFVYQMVCCYEDRTPFIQAAAQRLKKCKSNGDWLIFSLSELLHFFALDGNEDARKALEDKYYELYDKLLARRQPKEGTFPERDDFCQLCVIRADDRQSFLQIAEDIGRLYRCRSFYDGFDFDWLYESKGKCYSTALKKAAVKSENLACYLQKQQEYEQEISDSLPRPMPERKGRSLSVWLAKKADKETVMRYAQEYLQQKDKKLRAEALELFCRCPFPEDPTPILVDAESDCEELCNAAWEALEQIRHPLVRKYAFEKLGENPEKLIPIFIKNFQESDADLLEKLVTSIKADFRETTNWHGIYLAVLGMEDDGLKAPTSILKHIYENSFCSLCRERALRQMGKRHLLTEELLLECLYDSNEDIRLYAKRVLRRRKL